MAMNSNVLFFNHINSVDLSASANADFLPFRIWQSYAIGGHKLTEFCYV